MRSESPFCGTHLQLGRGTAPQEGIGISHAIAESLIQIKVQPRCITHSRSYSRQASVFFATHFKDLGFTLELLPGVVK
jgi:DNA mismatch repair protein MSH4